MYINRDITQLLTKSTDWIQILLGPRQCGKSTLFASLYLNNPSHESFQEITFDDFQMRQLANRDPALFLQQFETPLLLDEVQYVPNLFPALKEVVDKIKRARTIQNKNIKPKVLFRLTGSNQILMDKNVKESLAGRASYFYLNTLTVHEILNALPETTCKEILFKGGWPELYANNNTLSVTSYLNDYIRSYVEKDIVIAAGINKTSEFLTVLRLCAARTGQETDYSDIQKDSGVSSVTVKEWIGILERADLVFQLRPYFNNISKRQIKRPKLYFLDTGLAVRLQGWSEILPLTSSPQIGGLFETLVVDEIVKFIRNYGKDWEVFFWRTKDGREEIDIIIKTAHGEVHAFEAKYAIHGVTHPIPYPPAFKKEFSPIRPLVIVTAGGEKLKLSNQCLVFPIAQLHDYLHEI